MKRRTPIARIVVSLCVVLATQAKAQGVPTTGPAAVYEMQEQVKAIANCLASKGDSLSLCLCLVRSDDSQSGTQRLAKILRCLDEQEASQ